MGIYVHKALGYGLLDLKTRDGQIDDARVAGVVPSAGRGREEFLAYLRAHAGEDATYLDIPSALSFIEAAPSWEPRNSFIYEPEGGIPEVLLLIPPGFSKSWLRRDDMLDWVEETMVPGEGRRPQGPRARELPRPLYPFDAWMDAESGDTLPTAAGNYLQIRRHAQGAGGVGIDLDQVARGAGFVDAADADRRIVPWVPPSVRLLASFLGIFAEDRHALALRPIVYVWWS